LSKSKRKLNTLASLGLYVKMAVT